MLKDYVGLSLGLSHIVRDDNVSIVATIIALDIKRRLVISHKTIVKARTLWAIIKALHNLELVAIL